MSTSSSTPTPVVPGDDSEYNPNKPRQIHISVPPNYYLLPGAAIILGTTLGLVRGSRRASLRFLAENVHRPPTTVQGWYFYNKTKNYRVMMGGLREAGADALRLGAAAVGWVAAEEGAKALGGVWADAADVLAGVGTAGVFSLVYRLPRQAAGRTMILGLLVGCTVSGLRWSQVRLRERAIAAKAQVADVDVDATTAEGGADVAEGGGAVGEAPEAKA